VEKLGVVSPLVTKKSERRRQKRRQDHQGARIEVRKQRQRAVADAVEATRSAVRELADVAASEAVSPETFADQVVEVLRDDLCAKVLTNDDLVSDLSEEIVERSGAERAAALAEALAGRLSEESRVARLAISISEDAGDLTQAGRITEVVLGAAADDDADAGDFAAELAQIRMAGGELGDALEVLDVNCTRWPGHDELQSVRARALAWTVSLIWPDDRLASMSRPEVSAEQLEKARSFLDRFNDRSLLYRLRTAVEEFMARDSVLREWREQEMAAFLSEVRQAGSLGPFDEMSSEAGPLAAEYLWLGGPDDPDTEDLADGFTVLGRFAGAPDTAPALADTARSWYRHVRYGLWQVAGEGPASTDMPAAGVWVADLVTRRLVYAAIPAEQLKGLPRWSVLAGPLAPLGGVWRSGESLVVLDPALADRATEAALRVADEVVFGLAREHGIKAPRPRPDRSERPRPHGVLVDVLDAMDSYQADLTAKVLGGSLSNLVGMVEEAGRRLPALSNTDGDPIELISAVFPADDPAEVRRKLLTDEDFDSDDRPGEPDEVAGQLTWLGRQMSEAESANSLAQLHAEARKRGWGPIEPPVGPRRWLRGTVVFEAGAIRVEVNSRQRLQALSAKLSWAGAQAKPTVRSRIDPSMDLALPGGRLRGGRAGDPEAEETWRQHWPDEKVPALDNATPRAAAKAPRKRVLLESLLRQFEHDADSAANEGEQPLDVDQLRADLGMQDGVLG
jgi:hypothetical protein